VIAVGSIVLIRTYFSLILQHIKLVKKPNENKINKNNKNTNTNTNINNLKSIYINNQ